MAKQMAVGKEGVGERGYANLSTRGAKLVCPCVTQSGKHKQ